MLNVMPGLVPGMMLLGSLLYDPGMVVGINILHRQDHDGRSGVAVQLLHSLAHAIRLSGAGLDNHDNLFSPLDFALPPVMRDHSRHDIDASREAPFNDGTPRPLRLDNRWPSRIDEHRAFHSLTPYLP